MQSRLDAHETPSSASAFPRTGTRSSDQDEPFHRSASGSGLEFLPYDTPTATHVLVEGHDTDDSHPDQTGEPGVGVCSGDHVEPFQRSTKGTGSFVTERSSKPTATQSCLDAHDTAFSPVWFTWAGRGTRCTDQPAAAAG
jgi:hypothetical protein